MVFQKITICDVKRRRTRIIYGGSLNELVSPVTPLLKTISGALEQIAPERYQEYERLISSGICIEIDACKSGFHITADVIGRKVILGIAALERIWAYTYFYLALTEEIQKNGNGNEIDLTSTTALNNARILGLWAHDCEEKKERTPWPEGLPRPDRDNGSDDHIGKSNPYFYYAVAFMVLHEIAHIQKEHHTNKYENKNQAYALEYEADDWAAHFLLDKWQEAGRGERDFIGRCTGIALGITILIGVELYHHPLKDDHPNVAERLLNFFNNFNRESVGPVANKTDFPKYFAIGIIHGLFQKGHIPFDYGKSHADFTDYLIDAHRALEEHKC